MVIVVDVVKAITDDVRALIAELEETLARDYSPEQRHGLALDNLFEPHVRFFLARMSDDSDGGGAAVGCGGVALFADYAEVKRMYVRPAFRGQGVAEALLTRIEATALDAGLVRLCLETGEHSAAAIRLYTRMGFTSCAAFGHYALMPKAHVVTSVFFEKHLG